MVFSMYETLIMIYAGILMIYATIGEGYTVCMLLCRSSLRVVVFLRSPPARVTTDAPAVYARMIFVVQGLVPQPHLQPPLPPMLHWTRYALHGR